MKLFTARPPTTLPANPPMFLGLVGWCKGQAGLDRNGKPDPYRATIIDIGSADNVDGASAIIGGSLSAPEHAFLMAEPDRRYSDVRGRQHESLCRVVVAAMGFALSYA